MKSLAVLYICTGKYIIFWKEFYESMKRYFLLNTDVHYYVFTDSKVLDVGNNDSNVHLVFQEDLGWPGNTIYRFRMFKTIEEKLKNYDYLYFFNANYVCLKNITEEEFLPVGEQLVVTLHPGFYNKQSRELPYDRNPESTAYISYFSLKSHYYFCGGLNGGSTKKYLKLINDLNRQIEEDDKKGVIALWHDESHLNKYMLKQNNYKILSPSYAYPEEWKVPFEPKLFLLDKRKFFNLKGRYENPLNQVKLSNFQNKIVTCLDQLKYHN